MRALALLMTVVCSVAQAQTCERPAGASAAGVAGLSDEERLAFLSKLLAEESERSKTWTLAWGAIFAGLGMGQLALAPLFPSEEKPAWYWGAAATGVGLAFTLIARPEVQEAGPVFARRASTVSAEDRCALIAEGERLLERGAAKEQAGFAWYLYAGNVAFNLGLGLVLGLGYGDWRSGIQTALIGTAVGTTQIASAPSHLISGWKRYRNGPSPAVTFHVVPTAGPGLAVMLSF